MFNNCSFLIEVNQLNLPTGTFIYFHFLKAGNFKSTGVYRSFPILSKDIAFSTCINIHKQILLVFYDLNWFFFYHTKWVMSFYLTHIASTMFYSCKAKCLLMWDIITSWSYLIFKDFFVRLDHIAVSNSLKQKNMFYIKWL